jgi:hypothetical protein
MAILRGHAWALPFMLASSVASDTACCETFDAGQTGQASPDTAERRHDLLSEQAQGAQSLLAGESAKEKRPDEVV